MKLLAIGDIVGEVTVQALRKHLWNIRTFLGADVVIANGENATEIRGLSAADATALLDSGIDLLTSGNHIWGKRDLYPLLDEDARLLRPANYPAEAPGRGSTILTIDGYRILCINVQGTVYLDPLASPFETVNTILTREAGHYDFAVLDIHAEATSEKLALAHYFDGRIAAVWGTHTHVQTADESILPHGTGYLTDLGMTGPSEGILGTGCEPVIERFLTHMPTRFTVAEGPLVLCGALFDIDTDTFRTRQVERVRMEL